MIVHVVKPGETLWGISVKYQTTAAVIQSLNGLTSDILVPGIALVVPSTVVFTVKQHVISQGETLWSISREFNIPLQLLLAFNPEKNELELIPGNTILVPNRVFQKRTIETSAYLVITGSNQDVQFVRQFENLLTYVCIFTYSFDLFGQLQTPIKPVPKVAGVKFLMVVSNLVSGGNFSIDLAHKVLESAKARQTLIEQMIQELQRQGYAGVNLDIEHILPSDRNSYNSFVEQVVRALKPLGFLVTVAIPPKPFDNPNNEWVGGYDYQAIGAAADRIMLMTYDWGFPIGRPQAVAPVDKIRDVLRYAFSLMDSTKVHLGMPLYGDDWPLPHSPARPANIVVNQTALLNAIANKVPIYIDPLAVAPFYYYRVNGVNRVVWYNDALSILAKAELVREFNIGGFFFWALGYDFPQNWVLINDVFQIR